MGAARTTTRKNHGCVGVPPHSAPSACVLGVEGWKGGGASPSPARSWGGRGAVARGCKTARSARSGAVVPIVSFCVGTVATRSSLDGIDATQAGAPRRLTAVAPTGQMCIGWPACASWGGDELALPAGTVRMPPAAGVGGTPCQARDPPPLGRLWLWDRRSRRSAVPSWVAQEGSVEPMVRVARAHGPPEHLHRGNLGEGPDKRCRIGTVQVPLVDTGGLSPFIPGAISWWRGPLSRHAPSDVARHAVMSPSVGLFISDGHCQGRALPGSAPVLLSATGGRSS